MFDLSPGITPLLTDIFVLLVPLSIGLEQVARRTPLVGSLALPGCLLLMASIKLFTDYSDPPDALLAGWGVLLSLTLPSVYLIRAESIGRGRALTFLVALGAGGVLLGAIKVRTDFFDPFDLLLSVLLVLAGAALVGWVIEKRRVPLASAP